MAKIPYKFVPIPESFVDFLLPFLSESELKVLLCITRSTWGFQKPSDSIAMSQFRQGRITKAGKILCRGTGLSNETIQKAIYVLERSKIIAVEKELGNITVYRLNYEFPITELKKEHFDAARWSYTSRERKFKVSPARMETFLKNRGFHSIGSVCASLMTRNTISTVTPDTFSKNTETDINGTNVPLQASSDIKEKKKEFFSKTKDTKSDKKDFVQKFIERGLPDDVACKHVEVSSVEDLTSHLRAIDEASEQLKKAYIESWTQSYRK